MAGGLPTDNADSYDGESPGPGTLEATHYTGGSTNVHQMHAKASSANDAQRAKLQSSGLATAGLQDNLTSGADTPNTSQSFGVPPNGVINTQAGDNVPAQLRGAAKIAVPKVGK